jgi:CRP-like cAMP-binding protein
MILTYPSPKVGIQTLGVFLLAYVVGNLLDIVQVMDGKNRLFYSNINYVRKLIAYFRFNEDIEMKIKHFYLYRLCHSIHEEHLLSDCLPSSLAHDIRLFLLTPMLKKVRFLQDESSNVTRVLVSQMTQRLVMRGEDVVRQGEIGTEMYFIYSGYLEVFVASTVQDVTALDSGNCTRVNSLKTGSFFGEKSLFSNHPRNATIKAKTFCTLYKLSRVHLESVFAHHPEWKAKVMQVVKTMYEEQEQKMKQQEKEKVTSTNSDRSQQNIGTRHKDNQFVVAGSNSKVVPAPTHAAFSLRTTSFNGHQSNNSSNTSGKNLAETIKKELEKKAATLTWIQMLRHTLWLRFYSVLYIEVESPFYRTYLIALFMALLHTSLSIPYMCTFGHNGVSEWSFNVGMVQNPMISISLYVCVSHLHHMCTYMPYRVLFHRCAMSLSILFLPMTYGLRSTLSKQP